MVGYSVLLKTSFLTVYTADIIYVKDVRECDTNHCRMQAVSIQLVVRQGLVNIPNHGVKEVVDFSLTLGDSEGYGVLPVVHVHGVADPCRERQGHAFPEGALALDDGG